MPSEAKCSGAQLQYTLIHIKLESRGRAQGRCRHTALALTNHDWGFSITLHAMAGFIICCPLTAQDYVGGGVFTWCRTVDIGAHHV